jgi:hypothetical protein
MKTVEWLKTYWVSILMLLIVIGIMYVVLTQLYPFGNGPTNITSKDLIV